MELEDGEALDIYNSAISEGLNDPESITELKAFLFGSKLHPNDRKVEIISNVNTCNNAQCLKLKQNLMLVKCQLEAEKIKNLLLLDKFNSTKVNNNDRYIFLNLTISS